MTLNEKLLISLLLFLKTQVFSQNSNFVTIKTQNSVKSFSDDFLPFGDQSCRMWPRVSKVPLECCSIPEFFDLKIKSQCISYCTRPDEISFNTACCTTQCLFEESEFIYEGMINVENVKNILTKALKTNEKLLSKLDKIIQNCVKKIPKMDQDATKDECETPQFNTFLNCIYEKIFNFCPEAKADIECKEIKEFMEKCPNAQRRFREARRTSIGPFKDNLAEAMREVINGKSTTKSVD